MNPCRTLRFLLNEPPAEFWLPVAPLAPGQNPEPPLLVNATRVACIHSSTTPQTAWLVRPDGPGPVEVAYPAELAGKLAAPELFQATATPRLRASPALRARANELLAGARDEDERLARLLSDVAEGFVYAHPPGRPPPDPDGVPPLTCGLTPGSCVDIHCHATALLAAAGFPTVYLAGLFVRAGRPADRPLKPGHCWIALCRADGRIECYDIAHHLEHHLPGPIRPALNPVPGERLALQSGCDHQFEQEGRVLIAERLLAPSAPDENGVLRALPSAVRWDKT